MVSAARAPGASRTTSRVFSPRTMIGSSRVPLRSMVKGPGYWPGARVRTSPGRALASAARSASPVAMRTGLGVAGAAGGSARVDVVMVVAPRVERLARGAGPEVDDAARELRPDGEADPVVGIGIGQGVRPHADERQGLAPRSPGFPVGDGGGGVVIVVALHRER